jgi:hypothetical protein
MKAKPVSKPVGAEQKWFSVQLEDLARRTDVAKNPAWVGRSGRMRAYLLEETDAGYATAES